MANDDKSERIKIEILDELDKLKYVNRKASYSKRIKKLLDFCDKNSEEFEKWLEKEEEK